MKLSAKRARFVKEYLTDLNATRAAEAAGYKATTAKSQGSRLLTYDDVSAAIQVGQSKRLSGLEITADRVLKEIARLAFSDVRKLFDADGNLKAIPDLDDDAAAALSTVEVLREKTTRRQEGEESIESNEHVVKVKSWDKPKSLELLAKHLRLLTDHIELGTPLPLQIELTDASSSIPKSGLSEP